jgi:response regulator RpfG family c-di-GMP phosphodiesterase
VNQLSVKEGLMADKILFVDDEPNLLAGIQRQLRKHFAIETALGGEQGLEAVREQGPFSVVVSDLRMPGMDGIQFLSRVRKASPDTVRMMLTGNADLQAAIEAVNEGNIYRFMTKPCPPETLARALYQGIGQYRLITAERELLEKTLRGSIKVLCEVLALLNPEAFGRASRITRYVKEIALKMGLADVWQVETASTLSQIGCIILPEDVLKKLYVGQELAGEELQLFNMHPSIAADLLTHIPRMQKIAEIITFQEKHFDGSGIPHEPRSGSDIPHGSRILKAVLDFDTLAARGIPKGESVIHLSQRRGYYDPAVLAALEAVLVMEQGYQVRFLKTMELRDAMILDQDLLTRDGRLLIARGYQVNQTMRERLKHFAQSPGIQEPIRVHVPVAGEDGIS